MTYRGYVKKGVIRLRDGASLQEGTEVRVQTLKTTKKRNAGRKTLGQKMLKYAGALKGLPTDLARNHDHYVHGRPRK
jgi:hypothetical protein